ncbi:AGE family epimerase/isomerase [Echinimonas agarilytica]|uniref:Cellobiose 2-epimerase n=1 Tax=Echinimonas agarilytica TaxID=1215918 RepID=A0AA41W4V0_9GAMM|nr:AGE family epimerase/isomerase [Echinimonas agarilytica]MCM2678704.1 AGE family epimerase/isomerase [Echinimonas agarilytica]
MSFDSSLKPLLKWRDECQQEARNIADWWAENTIDHEGGGFLGELNRKNKPVHMASKSIIQNTRILWFFSEYAHFTQSERDLAVATRAYDYLMAHFDDPEYGGVIWMVNYQGKTTDTKKQTYAIGFAIYALSAYYKLTGSETAIATAKGYFELLELHARDRQNNGYVEALSQTWQPLDDVRLSLKDENYPKTMNTHLHILEAYTALHAVAPDSKTEEALGNLIEVFEHQIIDAESNHLKLFLDMDWKDHSTFWSYGHDIECSWLLYEALEALDNEKLINRLTPTVINMAQITLEQGIGEHGQVLDQIDLDSQTKHPESHWWVQAEALVGFLNAYYLTEQKRFLEVNTPIWDFICKYHMDKEFGEWHWLSTLDQPNHPTIYKAGGWKAPYHNGRAMLEICKLVDKIKLFEVPKESA